MKFRNRLMAVVIMTLCISGCASVTSEQEESEEAMMRDGYTYPDELVEVPDEYYEEMMENAGTLVDFYYDTYESFTYESHEETLHKRAIVYLPYGYDESRQYPVFYLMHGGWSDETVYLGSEENPGLFKNLLDHAMYNGEIEPMIVVSPTYNNLSEQDSGDYSLAIQLTNQYHNELENDLIPAIEGTYSTYAESTDHDGLVASRDHRGFGGFSMGSVQTWRTFQYNLDLFHYFLPSSGNLTSDGSWMAEIVDEYGYDWNDFFIFAASGSQDFAQSAFKQQIDAMSQQEIFRYANNEQDGNLYYLEQEGNSHDGYAAMQYLYNGMMGLWKEKKEEDVMFTKETTVQEVIDDKAFSDYGRLLFPVDLNLDTSMTLEEISSSSVYIWYNYIQADTTVEILNHLKQERLQGNQIFYSIYNEEEINEDPSRKDSGLFFFRGDENERFAIMNAGGGFYYVGAMHDSFPHALEASKAGYNAFALIYRPEYAYEDLAQAIVYIHDHAEELKVDVNHYSLWGGSAGARMAASLGNSYILRQLTEREDITQASAVIMQYTGYSTVSDYDAPTYANCGTRDGIASYLTMRNRLQSLSDLGIPVEFHSYDGLPHGYGIGKGTIAEGWILDAFNFWDSNSEA